MDIEQAKEVDFNFINYVITKKYLLFRRDFHYVKFSDKRINYNMLNTSTDLALSVIIV